MMIKNDRSVMTTERLTATTSGLDHFFRMTWHQEGAGQCTRRILISDSKEELIAALSIPVPALVTIELIDNGRVMAAVVTSAADLVRWDPVRAALPNPVLGLPRESPAAFAAMGTSQHK